LLEIITDSTKPPASVAIELQPDSPQSGTEKKEKEKTATGTTDAGSVHFKIVVFVDDLDRLQPEKVPAILEAINMVLTASGMITVIGMVREHQEVAAMNENH
jgi:hypothetical protein